MLWDAGDGPPQEAQEAQEAVVSPHKPMPGPVRSKHPSLHFLPTLDATVLVLHVPFHRRSRSVGWILRVSRGSWSYEQAALLSLLPTHRHPHHRILLPSCR